jgi:hypothetical protein
MELQYSSHGAPIIVQVIVARFLRGDPCAALLASNIDAFLRSVEAGDDLTPYMSLQSHTRGYTPAS